MLSQIHINVVVLLLAAVTFSSCAQEEVVVQEDRAISVQVRVVTLSDEQVARVFTGTVEGEQQADIYAKMAEAVEQVHVREGDAVRVGQVLVSLDKSGPSSAYRTAEAVYRNSEKNLKKKEYLFQEGAISESQLDAARTDFEVSRAAFESAARLVEIQSPIAGIVTSIAASVGDYLSQGQRLATVAATDRLRVRCSVNSRDIGSFTEGAEVLVTMNEGQISLPGKVASVSRSADRETRAFEVEVLFENVGGECRPGMFVRVTTVVEDLPGVIAVPTDAVVAFDGTDHVFVVADLKAVLQPVVLGPDLGGRVVINDGLNPGDTLVTLGHTYLADGFTVKISRMENDGQ
jgi:RND family efflux transporter MFP subunit